MNISPADLYMIYTLSIIGIAAFFVIIFMFCVTKKRPPLPAKDPSDFTKTKASTSWGTTELSCPKCFSACSHGEYMADVCNNCGYLGTINKFDRSYRRIWNGAKWKYQYKFRNGDIEIRDTPFLGDC